MNQPRSDPVRRCEQRNNIAFCSIMILFLALTVGTFYSVKYGLPAAQQNAGEGTSGKIILARIAFYLIFRQ